MQPNAIRYSSNFLGLRITFRVGLGSGVGVGLGSGVRVWFRVRVGIRVRVGQGCPVPSHYPIFMSLFMRNLISLIEMLGGQDCSLCTTHP